MRKGSGCAVHEAELICVGSSLLSSVGGPGEGRGEGLAPGPSCLLFFELSAPVFVHQSHHAPASALIQAGWERALSLLLLAWHSHIYVRQHVQNKRPFWGGIVTIRFALYSYVSLSPRKNYRYRFWKDTRDGSISPRGEDNAPTHPNI